MPTSGPLPRGSSASWRAIGSPLAGSATPLGISHHAGGRAPLVLLHDVAHRDRVDRDAVGELVGEPGREAAIDATVSVEAALADQGDRRARQAADQRRQEVALEEVAVHDLYVALRELAGGAPCAGQGARAQHGAGDAERAHRDARALEHRRQVAGIGGGAPHLRCVAVAIETTHHLEQVALRAADPQMVDHVGNADHAASAMAVVAARMAATGNVGAPVVVLCVAPPNGFDEALTRRSSPARCPG